MQAFFRAMQKQRVHPFDATGDHVRLYKEALTESGMKSASIARALSVIRGTYQQFGKKGLVAWDRVGDIQAVESPRVEKNTTPSLSEAEACRLLHAPEDRTVIGIRDHAILFTYFKTAVASRRSPTPASGTSNEPTPTGLSSCGKRERGGGVFLYSKQLVRYFGGSMLRASALATSSIPSSAHLNVIAVHRSVERSANNPCSTS
jgi:hypothetical protein